MRCEIDHKDGGVCQAPVKRGRCTRPEGHWKGGDTRAPEPETSGFSYAEWKSTGTHLSGHASLTAHALWWQSNN